MGKIDNEHKMAGYWELKAGEELRNANYRKAADDFENAANALREAGDLEGASVQHENAAHALEAEGGRLRKDGKTEEAVKAFKDAATKHEAAANNLKADGPVDEFHRFSYYAAAGKDRIIAGVAERDKDKKEAAKDCSQGQGDYNKAADAAKKVGLTDIADNYRKQAEAGCIDPPEDASMAHKKSE